MLKTKCIKSERLESDGLRISIMSRHTLSDGVTPDPEITDAAHDEWWPELAPPDRLIGAYYKRNMPWGVFENGYLSHLRDPVVVTKLGQLANRAVNEDITLLCIEENPEHCHRRLLAEVCGQLEPNLELDIN